MKNPRTRCMLWKMSRQQRMEQSTGHGSSANMVSTKVELPAVDRVSSSQRLSNPVHLDRTYASSIAAVGENEFVVHDGLDLFPEQPA